MAHIRDGTSRCRDGSSRVRAGQRRHGSFHAGDAPGLQAALGFPPMGSNVEATAAALRQTDVGALLMRNAVAAQAGMGSGLGAVASPPGVGAANGKMDLGAALAGTGVMGMGSLQMGAAPDGTGLPSACGLPVRLGVGGVASGDSHAVSRPVTVGNAGNGVKLPSWLKIVSRRARERAEATGELPWGSGKRRKTESGRCEALGPSRIDDRKVLGALAGGQRSLTGGAHAAGARALVRMWQRVGPLPRVVPCSIVHEARASRWRWKDSAWCAAKRWLRKVLGFPVRPGDVVKALVLKYGKRPGKGKRSTRAKAKVA